VRHYLLIYDQHERLIVGRREFEDAESALAARFEAEREYRTRPDIEVVILAADSWESVQRTHSRYFMSVQQLAEAALQREE
jgi:hypothetical protein